MSGRIIGYFNCFEADGRYLGAIMTTDHAGIPLEFKYTEPIKPTRIQAILYGGALERYIKVDVIRAKLAKSLQRKPEVLFIDHSDLSLLGLCENMPVVAIQKAHIQPLDSVGASRRPKGNELIAQVHEGDPLRLIFPSDSDELISRVQALVLDVGQTMDVAEPLERIESALQALLKESDRKAAD